MNSKTLLDELEHELISTAQLLDLVPAENLDWRPHAKAMTLGQLAYHVAVIPVRYLGFADDGFTDVEELTNHHIPKDKKEILMNFRIGLEDARQLLKKVDDEWVGKLWRLTKHGNDVFTLPIPFFIRLLVLNHLYHHRGQLSTYLRSLGFLLPSIYGPSADEDPFA